ncbi:MAG: hypothetical protein VB835_16430 [Pirellulales bacterium]
MNFLHEREKKGPMNKQWQIAVMLFTMLKAYPVGAEANQPIAAFETLSTQFFENNCTSCQRGPLKELLS